MNTNHHPDPKPVTTLYGFAKIAVRKLRAALDRGDALLYGPAKFPLPELAYLAVTLDQIADDLHAAVQRAAEQAQQPTTTPKEKTLGPENVSLNPAPACKSASRRAAPNCKQPASCRPTFPRPIRRTRPLAPPSPPRMTMILPPATRLPWTRTPIPTIPPRSGSTLTSSTRTAGTSGS
jgi:hypothetical protein